MRISLRKAARDLRRQRTQVGAVALTVLLGVALFVTAGGAFRNLSESYRYTYDRLGFADLIATSDDPVAVADAAAAAGAATTQVRTSADLPLRLADTRLLGRVIGLPAGTRAAVDDVDVIEGSYLAADDPDGVLLEKHAAATFDLAVGDRLEVATATGWHAVTVRGVVVSAEYLWPARNRQEVIGDPHGFAVVFAGEDQARAWSGSGPDQALVLLGGADRGEVTAAMRAAGAHDVTWWTEQPSHATLKADLDGFEEMSVAFPLLFLTAAAVAAYVLLARRVLSERATIGTFMAAGARRSRVVAHYVAQGVLIGLGGAVLGAALGAPLTALVTRAYTGALGIPDTIVRLHPDLIGWGLVLGVVVGVLGSAAPATLAARTVPAEAMRNRTAVRAPGWWSRAVARLRLLPVTVRMALRDVVRNPRRTLATMLGSVLALVLVLASLGMLTSILSALDTQFDEVQLEDAVVAVDPARADAVLAGLEATAGVRAAEPAVTARVTATFGDRSYLTDLQGFEPGTAMHGFLAESGEADLAGPGVLAGVGLADQLDVAVGDTLTLVAADGTESSARLDGLLAEPLGTALYATSAQVEDLVGDVTPLVLLSFDEGVDRDVMRATVTATDGVLGYSDTRAVVELVDQYLGLFWVVVGIFVAMGAVLALAVIQVTMAVTLAERTQELATLRAAGVTVRRVAGVLATENLLAVAAGIPIGLVAGVVAAGQFMATFTNDMFSLPLDLGWWALALAALGVLAAAALSQLPAAASIRRLDVARVARERAA